MIYMRHYWSRTIIGINGTEKRDYKHLGVYD
ncbi:BnaA10g03860D [Brassica napus]|uniref:BnaA10g03860D protein n=1 Tax=Brassica napus TaxID=3708 RepID=A0A078IC47_BRANA|nr:BnaA10g03860D [Brassica napus]